MHDDKCKQRDGGLQILGHKSEKLTTHKDIIWEPLGAEFQGRHIKGLLERVNKADFDR